MIGVALKKVDEVQVGISLLIGVDLVLGRHLGLLFSLPLLLMLLPVLILTALPLLALFEFFCLDDDPIQDQWLHLGIIHHCLLVRNHTAQRRHAGDNDDKNPSIAEVRSHLLYLYLLKFANSLMQTLLDIAL
jgi:hypothetical protein